MSRTRTLVKLDPIGTGSLQVGEQLLTDRDSEEIGQKRLEVQLGLASDAWMDYQEQRRDLVHCQSGLRLA